MKFALSNIYHTKMASEQDVIAGENVKGKTGVKSPKKHFDQQRKKCERILHYLCHGKHIDGLTKNQQRVVRGQAKTYTLDESEFIFFFICCKQLCLYAYSISRTLFI